MYAKLGLKRAWGGLMMQQTGVQAEQSGCNLSSWLCDRDVKDQTRLVEIGQRVDRASSVHASSAHCIRLNCTRGRFREAQGVSVEVDPS